MVEHKTDCIYIYVFYMINKHLIGAYS